MWNVKHEKKGHQWHEIEDVRVMENTRICKKKGDFNSTSEAIFLVQTTSA